MADSITSLVAEAKRSKYSLINHLSEDDVLAIWDGLSDFIEKQMLQVKGVCLHGFGTFTFSQRKIDVGSGKVLMIQRPVFVMSENFVQTHSLSYPKQLATGQIPVVSLNYTVLSNGTPYNRDTVELSIREIVQALGKAVVASKNINMDFPKIGRLMIREKRGRMRFFKEFLRSIDSTGKIEYSFSPNTPHGSDGSIMSDPMPKILPSSTATDSSVTTTSLSPKKANVEERPGTPYHTPRPATVIPFSSPPSISSDVSSTGALNVGDSRPSTCSYCSDEGKNMCYICHQRELRNVPVYLAEERKRKEKLHEKLLHEFQQKKATLLLAQEKARKAQHIQRAKEAAEFNLNATEKRKLREMKDSIKYSDYHPSCVFMHHPLTPCFSRKQMEYCRQLDEQVRRRRDAMHVLKQQQDDLERQEQLQLSKELELIKEAYKTKMQDHKASYLQALNDQVHLKTYKSQTPSPAVQPIFVIQETSPSTITDDRDRAKEFYRDQLATFLEKERAQKVKALKEREEDAHQLQLNLKDFTKDLQKSRIDRSDARKNLEEYWQETLKRKELEVSHLKDEIPKTFLLHDQCKKYSRCRQCQRKVDNIGQSNILSESRYISGARLIV